MMTELMTAPLAARPTPEVRLQALSEADFGTAVRYFVGGMLGGLAAAAIGVAFSGAVEAGFLAAAGLGIALAAVNAFFAFFSVPGSTGPGTADGWRRRIGLLIAGVAFVSISGVMLHTAFIAACAVGAVVIVAMLTLLVAVLRAKRAPKRS